MARPSRPRSPSSKSGAAAAAKRAARGEQPSRHVGRRPGRGAAAPYHHGALRDALLEAAERILERDGLSGLTLRAAAREAGVSHAAPTHHFRDLTGLLSELAAVGFMKFAEALTAEAAAQASPIERLQAMGRGYVTFARRHPGLFTLMFRSDRLDPSRPALQAAMTAAGTALVTAVSARRGEVITREAPSLSQVAAVVRTWSKVHGFAVLLLDGRLREFLSMLPRGDDEMALLAAVLTPEEGSPP